MSWNVAAVMTTDVVAVAPGSACEEVVERLRERCVSAAPVVDAECRVIGIVSAADLLLKARARNAAALMTSPVTTIRPEATLAGAARLMHGRHVKRLPVVDPGGRLVGIVSRADLLQVFLRPDESIEREVREDVLLHALAIDPAETAVTVEDGVVRLEGLVETRSLAAIAARLAGAVEGVVDVEGGLRWRVDDSAVEVPTDPLAAHCSADERGRTG
jgi:CBS-domain-containing membrane protein